MNTQDTKQSYADMLYSYPLVKETIAAANASDSYAEVLRVAQRITRDPKEGGYASQVADRAYEWFGVQRRQVA